MYGLNKSVKLDFLLGKQLIQVCIGSHQTILRFDGDTIITVEGLSRLAAKRGSEIEIHPNRPEEAGKLVCLLGRAIQGVVNTGNGDIELVFTSGESLKILDSNKNYESYQIESIGVEGVIV